MNKEDRKIRMATADKPSSPNTQRQGHTIVGGRPAGARATGSGIPRGLEALMMKAAVDSAFLDELVARRAKLADEIGLELDTAEREMLQMVPESHLREMARVTPVSEPHRKLLSGGSAAAILALVGQLTFAPVAGRASETPIESPQSAQTQLSESGSYATQATQRDVTTIAAGDITTSDEYLPTGGANQKATDRIAGDRITRGIRPDVYDSDQITKGIRPDLPDIPSIPIPTTPAHEKSVATSPLTIQTLRELIVHTNSTGMTFEAAIDALRRETGLTITFQAPTGLDTKQIITKSVAGLSLNQALHVLCSEAAGEGALYEVDISDDSLLIRFKRLGNKIQSTPSQSPQLPHSVNERGVNATSSSDITSNSSNIGNSDDSAKSRNINNSGFISNTASSSSKNDNSHEHSPQNGD